MILFLKVSLKHFRLKSVYLWLDCNLFYLVVLLVVVVVLLVVVLLAGLLSKLMLLAKIFLEDPPVDLGKSSGMILLLVETDVRRDLEAVRKIQRHC